MIIDCHGHFTTVPKALNAWRQKQLESDGKISTRVIDLYSLPQFVPNNAIQSLRMLNADVEVATDNTLQSLVCPTTSTGLRHSSD